MRTLHVDLTAAQKQGSIKGLYKIVLSKSGESDVTYEQDKIYFIRHEESDDSQGAEVLLTNYDQSLNSVDFRAWKGVISIGMTDANGVDRYSARAPMWVIAQQFRSFVGKPRSNRSNLLFSLSLAGVSSMLQTDRSSVGYYPTADDTNTVKALITALLDGTMTGFTHTDAYTVVFDSEDAVIASYMPKTSFRVQPRASRLFKLKQLLSFTTCRFRIENDGADNAEIHIFVPTTTGASYDYEYSLASGSHSFYEKGYRDRLVIPNHVVVAWPMQDNPDFIGAGEDTESFALMDKRDYHFYRVKSNVEATNLAESILAGHQVDAQKGFISVPMNVGQEVWDYVKVTDTREGQNAIGNVVEMVTTCGGGEWGLAISFGKVTLKGLSGTALPQTATGGGISTNDLYSLIKQLWEIVENMMAYLEYLDLDFIKQAVMTTWGDILFRGKNEAERLGPSASTGYWLLRSLGEGINPEWFDIEALINFLTGAVNRAIAASLAIPTPTIVLATAEDHSGGAFTAPISLPALTVPTVSAAAAAYTVAAVTGAIADDGGAQTDETTPANNATANDMTLLPAVPVANDAYYFGADAQWDWLSLEISTAGDGVWTIVWEYYNGSSWVALTGLSDTTVGFTQSGSVAFLRPGDWATATIILANKYWIRGRVSAYTSIVTQPLGQQAWIGTH